MTSDALAGLQMLGTLIGLVVLVAGGVFAVLVPVLLLVINGNIRRASEQVAQSNATLIAIHKALVTRGQV